MWGVEWIVAYTKGLSESERASVTLSVANDLGEEIATHEAPMELLAADQWRGTAPFCASGWSQGENPVHFRTVWCARQDSNLLPQD